MNGLSTIETSHLTTLLGIFSLVFLMIAVIGKSRLAFIEINPGIFGRLLALLLGIFSLAMLVLLLIFPVEFLDVLRTSFGEQLQRSLNSLRQLQLFS